jgi:small subunit ribosomal protein S3Ae
MASKKQGTPKIRKKKWLTLIAPKLFNEQAMGETPTYEDETVIGIHLVKSLMDLTRDVRKQTIKVRFKVREVINENAFTDFIGYELLPSSLRRMVRRGKDKVEDRFSVVTKDNLIVVIKPILITNSKTNASVLTRLRKGAQQAYAQHAKKITFSALSSDVVTGKLQRAVREKLTKIYPVRISEVKLLRLVGTKAELDKEEEVLQGKVEEVKEESVKEGKIEPTAPVAEEVKVEA